MYKKIGRLLVIILVGMLMLLILVVLGNGLRPPTPLSYNGKTSKILTNSQYLQLFSLAGIKNLIFHENYGHPHIYGWKGDTLYFRDTWNQSFTFNPYTEQLDRVDITNTQFNRQTAQQGACNIINMPTYSYDSNKIESMRMCDLYVQGEVRVEAWPFEYLNEKVNLLAVTARHLEILKNDTRIDIAEPRLIKEIVISENGNFIAITVSEPGSDPTFYPTNVHLITL